MLESGSQHKVYLEKRSGEEPKPEPGITCSICGHCLPGARELGVHILAEHCDANLHDELQEDDNLVIDGVPGLSMEIDQDQLLEEQDPLIPHSEIRPTPETQSTALLELPRAPTGNELKQKFMAYRVSDTSHRYICLVCEKVYTSRYNIRMHMNLHTGNNVHTCEHCNRKFAHKHVYESHVRTHTGERPFACEKCDRRFGDRSNCASHMKRCAGVNEEKEHGESINIAPNVSITPIKRVKKEIDEEEIKTEHEDGDAFEEDPLRTSFKPQIVSVHSMTGNNNNVEFENMGYAGEDEDEENMDEDEEASEEMTIEPDISLDYDDIEEMGEPGDQLGKSTTFYTCSFCLVKYGEQSSLLDHLSTHVDIPHAPVRAELEQGYMTLYTTARPKFMCLFCGKFFTTAPTVEVHIKVHVEDKFYTCDICEKIFLHQHVFEKHMKTEHNYVKLVRNNTQDQNKSFSSKPLEITSQTSSNNNLEKKKPKANRPPPKLIMLSNSNSSLQSRNLAAQSDHIIVQNAEKRTPVELTRKPITIAPKPTVLLLTEEARKIFNNSAPTPCRTSPNSNPRAHKIVETPAGREYIPDTNSNNIVNLDTVYPPPSTAETKRGFMLRLCGSGGQQRYVCVDCGKHYTTSYNVRMHRNIHLGKNLYSCKFCMKEFSHKHVWETHERVHTGERPFKCPTCPKDFADRSNYNSHKKICVRLQQQCRRESEAGVVTI